VLGSRLAPREAPTHKRIEVSQLLYLGAHMPNKPLVPTRKGRSAFARSAAAALGRLGQTSSIGEGE
jgi:hypothetical protein